MHVKAGTSVSLSCLISNVLKVPSYVFWYHDGRRLIDGDDDVSISATSRASLKDGIAVSVLAIDKPRPEHSGVYACKPNDLDRASVNLHVIREEKPAAMQHEADAAKAVAEASSPASSVASRPSVASAFVLALCIVVAASSS